MTDVNEVNDVEAADTEQTRRSSHCYQVGDRVNWLFRPRGGYGYAIPVAAVVERVGSSRVTIRVARRVFIGKWKIETKCVHPRFLSRRNTVCEQLGET